MAASPSRHGTVPCTGALTACVDKRATVAAGGCEGAVVEEQILEVVNQLDAAVICERSTGTAQRAGL